MSIWAALAMMGWPSPALPMASLPFSTISLKGVMTSSSTSSMVEARSESASTAYWLVAIPSQGPCDADVAAAAAAAAVEVVQSQLQQNVVRLNVRLGSAGCVERAQLEREPIVVVFKGTALGRWWGIARGRGKWRVRRR